MTDIHYINGMIAVKERSLLGEKLLRCCEMTAEELLRTVRESGFGGGTAEDGEALCVAESAALDDFIRTYAPSRAIAEYLLSPRDFHNAKALCKANLLGTDPARLLAPAGLLPVDKIREAVESGETDGLGDPLGGAVREVLQAEKGEGAEIGMIFERALYRRLKKSCKRSGTLKKLLRGKADRTNILTALRAAEPDETLFVEGGTLGADLLWKLSSLDMVSAKELFVKTPYAGFAALCLEAKEAGRPFAEAERELDSFETEYFRAHRLELEGKEPFLYYVFRRRAEISDVRILFVCVNAGLRPQEIRKRLRAVEERR